MDIEKLITNAIDTVNMFDQANTNAVIEKSGSRGRLLKGTVQELRKTLNADKQRTVLREDQVQYKY